MKDAGGSYVPALGRRDFVKGTLCAVAGVGPALVRGDDAAASMLPAEDEAPQVDDGLTEEAGDGQPDASATSTG